MSSSDVLGRLTTHSTTVRIGLVVTVALLVAASGVSAADCALGCGI